MDVPLRGDGKSLAAREADTSGMGSSRTTTPQNSVQGFTKRSEFGSRDSPKNKIKCQFILDIPPFKPSISTGRIITTRK
jgi:hypothetical protein